MTRFTNSKDGGAAAFGNRIRVRRGAGDDRDVRIGSGLRGRVTVLLAALGSVWER